MNSSIVSDKDLSLSRLTVLYPRGIESAHTIYVLLYVD